MSSIAEMLDIEGSNTETQGEKALSSFGEEFMEKLDQLIGSHKSLIEPFLREKRDAKEEQKKLEAKLQLLIEELERKYERQWIPGHQKNLIHTEDQVKIVARSESTCEISISIPHNIKERPEEELNPSGLRTFLDEDYKKSDNDKSFSRKSRKPSRRKSEMTNTTKDDCDNENIYNSHSQVLGNMAHERPLTAEKSVARKERKISLKPQKEWVSDFSTISPPVPDETDCSSLSSITQREDSVQYDKHSNNDVLTLPHLEKKRQKKKENLAYEPNLSVVQRKLNLKREGSLSRGLRPKKE